MLKNRNIPFGYCVINGQYAINENEAEAVRKIFADYIGGESLKTIAAEMQIPYNSGKAVWNKNMVCRVLENAKYIGENGFPQIITVEDFEQAARIKAERRTYRKPAPQGWKVFRWTDAQLQKTPERVKDELVTFLGYSPALTYIDNNLPGQKGAVFELREHQE